MVPQRNAHGRCGDIKQKESNLKKIESMGRDVPGRSNESDQCSTKQEAAGGPIDAMKWNTKHEREVVWGGCFVCFMGIG